MGHSGFDPGVKGRQAWNAGRKLGAKQALKPQQVWAMFDFASDSKGRGCDIVKIEIGDVVVGGRIRHRVLVVE